MALSVPELTKSIDDGFAEEWRRRKLGVPLPSAGVEDRQLLFAAVARGLLTYLKATEKDLVVSITGSFGADLITAAVDGLSLDINLE